MSKIILAAGHYRSGSTWLFNAIRLLLKNLGEPVYSCWCDHYNSPDAISAKWHVVKIHRFNNDWVGRAHRIIVTERGVLCTKASMRRRAAMNPPPGFRPESKLANWDKFRKWHLAYKARADLVVRFPDIQRRTHLVLSLILVSLKLHRVYPVSVRVRAISQTIADLKALRIPKSNYDPVTLFHEGHITYPL